LAFSSLGR